MSNRLIITAASSGTEDLLLDFLISIRNEGEYEDKILLIDYGIFPEFSNWIVKKFNVIIKKCNISGYITNTKYLDLVEILKNEYKNYVVILSDADIWFEAPIEPLFKEYENSSKDILFDFRPRPENKRYKLLEKINFIKDQDYINKIIENIDFLKGHISSGFLIGDGNYLSNLFKGLSTLQDEYFADVAYFNHNYSEKNMGIIKHAPIGRDNLRKDLSKYIINSNYSINKFGINLNEDLGVVAVHDFSIDKKMTYKTNHFITFWKEMMS